MLVVLDGARDLPERIELPACLSTSAEIWPLRLAVEREIARHHQDILIEAQACIQASEPVLGWWLQLQEQLAAQGRKLTFIGLRPELLAAMNSLRGPLVNTHEVPQASANRGFAKAELSGQGPSLSAHQEPPAPLGTATILPLKY